MESTRLGNALSRITTRMTTRRRNTFDVNKYQDFLLNKFHIVYDRFNTLLSTHKAIIAGGSVLSVYSPYENENTDIDIYIHQSFAESFIDELSRITNNRVYYGGFDNNNEDIVNHGITPTSYVASTYDQSFFKKNGISARFAALYYLPRSHPNFGTVINIDILVVKNQIPLNKVVSNFDLTFCEISYDAAKNKIFATDPKGIMNKTGVLRKEYQESLFKYQNLFILRRIRKYSNRGFKIGLEDCKNIKEIKFQRITHDYSVKDVKDTDAEEFVTKLIITLLYHLVSKNAISRIPRVYENIQITPLGKDFCKFVASFKDFTMARIEPAFNTYLKKYVEAYYVFDDAHPFPTMKQIYLHLLHQYLALHSLKRKTKNFIFRYTHTTETEINTQPRDFNTRERERREYYSMLGIQDTFNNIRRNLFNDSPPEWEPPQQPEQPAHQEQRHPEHDIDMINIIEYNAQKCKDFFSEHETGIDLIMTGEVNLKEFLNEDKNNLVFITPENKAICINKDDLKSLYDNYNDNWFYECIGPIIQGTQDRRPIFNRDAPYFGLPIAENGLKGFIAVGQMKKLFTLKKQVYVIDALLGSGSSNTGNRRNQMTFTHTATYKNAFGERDYVSSNHCQAGSNILLYELYSCRKPRNTNQIIRNASSASRSTSGR